MNDKEASKANTVKEPQELAEKVNQYIRNNKISTKDIRAARTLPSGDSNHYGYRGRSDEAQRTGRIDVGFQRESQSGSTDIWSAGTRGED